jgi:hypothetical protein
MTKPEIRRNKGLLEPEVCCNLSFIKTPGLINEACCPKKPRSDKIGYSLRGGKQVRERCNMCNCAFPLRDEK